MYVCTHVLTHICMLTYARGVVVGRLYDNACMYVCMQITFITKSMHTHLIQVYSFDALENSQVTVHTHVLKVSTLTYVAINKS
jgi:hypothetical protein